MSLRRNTIANFTGTAYAAVIGVLIVPLLLGALGPEQFGLVGFYLLVHGTVLLLEFGLGPTLARTVAAGRGIDRSGAELAGFVRGLEYVYIAIALIVVAGFWAATDFIAFQWLDSESLDPRLVTDAIVLIGIAGGLRLVASLYRAGLRGAEDQVWANIGSIVITTLRFPLGLLLAAGFSADVADFFRLQVAVGLVEAAFYGLRLYSVLGLGRALSGPADWGALRQSLPLARSLAYVSALWVLISQTDKFVLSAVLSLREFGYFSIVSVLAGGILMLSTPISQAVLPRLTALYSAGRENDVVTLYRQSTQLTVAVAAAAALVLALFPEETVFALTGDRSAAVWAGRVLPYFAAGNAFLAISSFQYFLQNAYGNLRHHVIGSTISVLVLVPLIVLGATLDGARGVGIAWCGFRIVWFFLWMPVVHRSLVPGLHAKWMLDSVMPVLLTAGIGALVIGTFVESGGDRSRVAVASLVVLVSIAQLASAGIGSRFVRRKLTSLFLQGGTAH